MQRAVVGLVLLMLKNEQFHHAALFREFAYFFEPRNYKNDLNKAWTKNELFMFWSRKNEPWRLSIEVGQLIDVEYERNGHFGWLVGEVVELPPRPNGGNYEEADPLGIYLSDHGLTIVEDRWSCRLAQHKAHTKYESWWKEELLNGRVTVLD